MKSLRYRLEYALVWLLYCFFKVMPWRCASHIGGWIGRTFGPHFAASRKAARNIKRAFPDKSDDEIENITKDMWDNLGRVFAEYPHLDAIARTASNCSQMNIATHLRDDNKPGIIVGGHIANWEVAPYMFYQAGLPLHSIYRRPNNPYVANLLARIRSCGKDIKNYEKSRSGMLKIIRAMKQGEHIGMLVDQKYNEGVEATFFGHPAMTSTAFVELTQKFDCPLHFGRVIRVNKTSFTAELTEAIELFNKDGSPRPVMDVIDEYHRHLEQWITEHPSQWLWLHRRWKDI